MGKKLFFALAVLVAIMAAGVFIIKDENIALEIKESVYREVFLRYFKSSETADERNLKKQPSEHNLQKEQFKEEHERNIPDEMQQENRQYHPDSSTEELSISTVQESLKNEKEEEENEKENEQSKVPLGHMKKLGEHKEPEPQGAIEMLDYIPNGKDFYTHFIRKRRPLLMKGGATSWPAVINWHNESYLKEKYGEVIFDVEFRKVQSAAEYPVKKTMTMKEFLKMYRETPVYLDSPFPQSNLTEDLLVPFCMQCDEISSKFRSVHLLFSSGGTSSAFHQDGYENLLTMISGRKEVVLMNYTYSEYLYADDFETVPGLSPVHPEGVDLLKFPKVANVPFHKIILEPGDIFYIPQHWWHQVRSYSSPNIGVSIWFHQFEPDIEEEEEQPEGDYVSYREVLKEDARFAALVETYPETIECKKQNQPITDVFRPKRDWDTPEQDDFEPLYTTLISGYQMPMMGLGTGFLLDEALKISVRAALESGYRMFDTAQAYMNEETLGEVLSNSVVSRSDLFIVSKIHPRHHGFDSAILSIQDSLNKLKLDYLDLMLIHSMDCDDGPNARLKCEPGEPKGNWQDTWKAMEVQVKMGKVRSIGVSNFEVEDLKKLLSFATIPPSVVQNFFDPFIQDREVRQFCKKHNIQYMGFSNLGALYVLDMGFKENPVLTHEGLHKIASKYDVSVPQLVSAWALRENVIIIPRSKNPDHIAINFEAQHLKLSDEDFEYIHNLHEQLSFDDEYEEQGENDSKTNNNVKESSKDQGDSSADHSKSEPDTKDLQLIVKKKVNLEDATVFISSDDHWVYALDAITGDLMWKYETADETGSTLIFNHDGTVIYFGADDKHIRAVQSSDGKLLWKFKTGAAVTSSIRVGNDGTLYVGCLDHYIYALTPDGELRWKKNLGNEVWSSPALLDGGRVVFIGSMAEESKNVFAFNGSSGDIIWSYEAHGPVFSSPALNSDGQSVIFCSFDANCYGFDLETGRIMWVFHADGAFQSSPVVSFKDNVFYVASSEGTISAVDSLKGDLIWENKGHGEMFSCPFLAMGKVFIGTGTGKILALHQSNGTEVWSLKTKNDQVWSSPRLSQSGILYIGGIDGYVYAVMADNGTTVWEYKTDGPVVATPLITKRFALDLNANL